MKGTNFNKALIDESTPYDIMCKVFGVNNRPNKSIKINRKEIKKRRKQRYNNKS